MRYLLTGITGFAGPHLADLLVREGHSVYGLIRASNGREQSIRDVLDDDVFNELRFVYGDLLDYESCLKAFQDAKPDGVFHLAAQSHPPTSFSHPRHTFAVNATGTVGLVDALISAAPDASLMFCSTSEVYGAPDPALGAISEDFAIAPINPYGVSKAAADIYVRERALSLDRRFVVSRAFSHTGPRRGARFSIASDALQIAQIVKGLQEPVVRVGTLSSIRSVMDVRDVCRAYYAMIKAGAKGQAYNIGGSAAYSMGELLDRMLELRNLKSRVTMRVDPALVRPIDIPVQVCDSSKFRALTRWDNQIPIEQTLSDLLEYYERIV